VAGVIKIVLAMRHGLLPSTLYADEPSPHVDWESGEIKLLTEAVSWPAGERPRRAGVSSFGISGTNAHMILEEPPASEPVADTTPEQPALETGALPFVVSGSSGGALRAQAGRLRSFVEQSPDVELERVAAGLALGRAALSHRTVGSWSRCWAHWSVASPPTAWWRVWFAGRVGWRLCFRVRRRSGWGWVWG
jgi:acyl transferase domain-containing protein